MKEELDTAGPHSDVLDVPSSTNLHDWPDKSNCEAVSIADQRLENDESVETAPVHTRAPCNCGSLGFDSTLLSNLVRDGSLVLAQVSLSQGQLLLQMEPYQDGQEFISVSHAQSDSLGNRPENDLPKCQLERLRSSCIELMRNLGRFYGSSVRIWIDALCVPYSEISPDGASEMVIRTMRKVGALASAVLVVDSSIMRLRSDCSYEDTVRMIQSSRWASRLWTLCEAIQAKLLFFLLQDATIALFDIDNKANSIHSNDVQSLPYNALRSLALKHSEDREKTWRRLEKALHGRRTRSVRDAYGVFALIFRRSISDMLRRCDLESCTMSMSDENMMRIYKDIYQQIDAAAYATNSPVDYPHHSFASTTPFNLD